MNLKNLILTAALAIVTATSALGQTFDLFGSTRTLEVTAAKLSMTGTAASLATNVLDTRVFDGVGILNLTVVSNSADVAVTPSLIVTIEDSSDTTNYTTLANLATATRTSLAYTNSSLGVGTNIAVTDIFLLPGTLTTPVAATAGFSTLYLSPASYTGSGLFTNGSGSSTYQYGVNLNDTRRYIRVRYSLNGSNAVYAVGATLTGRTHGEVR